MSRISRLVLIVVVGLIAWVPLHSQTKENQTGQAPKPPTLTKPKAEVIDPDDVIRINTTLVNSPVLIIGRNGKFVPNLKREDFQIFEDGVEQEIANFATVDKPFTVALLIDTSRSTLFDLQEIQASAVSFVEKMRPDDRALIITFSDRVETIAEATSEPEVLKQAIRSIRPGGGSRVYDAVSYSLAKLAPTNGRTAVILFSDGVDNDSRNAAYEGTLQEILRSQALIYPVQFNTYEFAERGVPPKARPAPEGSGFSKQDYVRADAYLHQAAALSGTGVYPAKNISDLEKAVASIVDELHNEYSVGYYPRTPVSERARRIEVRTRFPQLVVRARTSYSIDPSGALARMPTSGSSISQSSVNPIGASPSRSEVADPAPEQDARWICKGVDAPLDFVVVKEAFVSRCPKSTRANADANAWFIRKPKLSEVVCKGFMMWRGREMAGAPIPPGYVVTSEDLSVVCSKSIDPKIVNNAWKIQIPSGRTTVCKGFPIPRGYVSAGETTVPGCPAKITETNAWIIRPKS